MSVLVSGLVWERSRHKGSDLLVLLAIADNANDQGVAYPGVKYLSRKTRLTPRAVQYALERLLRGSELTIVAHGGGRRSNVYGIQLDLLRGQQEQLHDDGEADATRANFASGNDPAPTQTLHPTHELGCTPPAKPASPKPSVEPSVEPSTPPNPPSGGRRRNAAKLKSEFDVWSRQHFPHADPRHVDVVVRRVRMAAEPTVDAIREYARAHPVWNQGIVEAYE